MGCRILEDREDYSAVFYCSTTMWAFGPVMEDREHAERFLKYLEPTDPRTLEDKDLMWRYSTFLQFDEEHCHECGERNTYKCKHGQCKGCDCCPDCNSADGWAELMS